MIWLQVVAMSFFSTIDEVNLCGTELKSNLKDPGRSDNNGSANDDNVSNILRKFTAQLIINMSFLFAHSGWGQPQKILEPLQTFVAIS